MPLFFIHLSFKSDHDWSEVSTSQDRLALEDQFFSHDIMVGDEKMVGERVGSVQSEEGGDVGWEGVKDKGVDVETQPMTSPPATQWHSQRGRGPDLPIAAHRHELLELIEENRIVCVEGETGCGKSTRVPQYILDYSLSLSPPRKCRVLVSQPRRMAAIKLAERVATERGE